MVTYFNRKDLVSFGSYLLSEKRKARIESKFKIDSEELGIKKVVPLEDRISNVYHADVENWLDDLSN